VAPAAAHATLAHLTASRCICPPQVTCCTLELCRIPLQPLQPLLCRCGECAPTRAGTRARRQLDMVSKHSGTMDCAPNAKTGARRALCWVASAAGLNPRLEPDV